MTFWPLKVLGENAVTTSGVTPSRDNSMFWQPPEIPWVKTGEVNFSPIVEVGEAISKRALADCSLMLLPPKTVLVAITGEGRTRGRSAVLELQGTTNQHCFAILPNDTWDADFLQLWLRSQYSNLRKLSSGRGGSRSALSGAQLNALKVPAPDKTEQRRIVRRVKTQLVEAEAACQAAQFQLREVGQLADAIVMDSVRSHRTTSHALGEVLCEVRHGIGSRWADYPVLGATRQGLAPAKEQPGKQASKYKPAFPGTVFYNPMRILIGSIAYVDDDDRPGITSPDYVALQGKPGEVDSRWFYYWLRSPLGVRCITSLARGAVRERMLFNRLADGEIALPDFSVQERASLALKELKHLRHELQRKIAEIDLLPQKVLSQVFAN